MKAKLSFACTSLPLLLHSTAVAAITSLQPLPAPLTCDELAQTPSPVSLTTQACFDSELDAVLNAANLYNPTSVAEDREFMGLVFEQLDAGRTRFGYTVGMAEPGSDRITIRARLPAGSRKVAFWHTHGADHWSRRYFSATDTQLAKDWGLPFYLATAEGELRVFHPEDRTMGRQEVLSTGLGNEIGASAGRVITSGKGAPFRIDV